MNGAGTGMIAAYQATRQAQARLRAMGAVGVAVLGTTTPTACRLPTGGGYSFPENRGCLLGFRLVRSSIK